MVSSCYLAKGKNVTLMGLSTRIQLNFGIVFVYVKPRKTLLSGEVYRIHVIVIKKLLQQKPLKKDAVELDLLLRVSYD